MLDGDGARSPEDGLRTETFGLEYHERASTRSVARPVQR
jgi:hypothetical protein